MPDTHINAYFADVDEAYTKVTLAHAEWEATKARLEAKKKEVGYVEPATPVEETPPAPQEKQDSGVTSTVTNKKR